jgi:hypothetical protein
MNKPRFVISSPFDTYSGYGARSRDIIKAIIELDRYKVELLPQRWGSTAWGFCKQNPKWGFLLNHVAPSDWNSSKPDIWMQITIPNEFQPVGKHNIGCTAGIESTSCKAEWVEGLNRMDINWVSSKHTKGVFESMKYEKRNQQTNQVVDNIFVKKPIHVVFEGVDLDIYNTNSQEKIDLKEVKENFNYLFVGHWMQGDLGHDRKNVGFTIKAFYETFKNQKHKPGLILKTSIGVESYMSRDEILSRIKKIRKTVNSNDLPNIYLINGEFSDPEMNALYNNPKIKAMISFTKGEGYGRPLLEFSLTGKPVIASGWSGQKDFLNPNFSLLLPGELEKVHPSASNDWLIPEAEWFKISSPHVGQSLKDVFSNYNKFKLKAKQQSKYSKSNFSWSKMKELVDSILSHNVPSFPQQLNLNIPQLDLTNLKKVE